MYQKCVKSIITHIFKFVLYINIVIWHQYFIIFFLFRIWMWKGHIEPNVKIIVEIWYITVVLVFMIYVCVVLPTCQLLFNADKLFLISLKMCFQITRKNTFFSSWKYCAVYFRIFKCCHFSAYEVLFIQWLKLIKNVESFLRNCLVDNLGIVAGWQKKQTAAPWITMRMKPPQVSAYMKASSWISFSFSITLWCGNSGAELSWHTAQTRLLWSRKSRVRNFWILSFCNYINKTSKTLFLIVLNWTWAFSCDILSRFGVRLMCWLWLITLGKMNGIINMKVWIFAVSLVYLGEHLSGLINYCCNYKWYFVLFLKKYLVYCVRIFTYYYGTMRCWIQA